MPRSTLKNSFLVALAVFVAIAPVAARTILIWLRNRNFISDLYDYPWPNSVFGLALILWVYAVQGSRAPVGNAIRFFLICALVPCIRMFALTFCDLWNIEYGWWCTWIRIALMGFVILVAGLHLLRLPISKFGMYRIGLAIILGASASSLFSSGDALDDATGSVWRHVGDSLWFIPFALALVLEIWHSSVKQGVGGKAGLSDTGSIPAATFGGSLVYLLVALSLTPIIAIYGFVVVDSLLHFQGVCYEGFMDGHWVQCSVLSDVLQGLATTTIFGGFFALIWAGMFLLFITRGPLLKVSSGARMRHRSAD